MDVKQFKLTNNDEIICTVLSYDSHGDFIVIDAFKILNVEDEKRGLKYYYFRPFMIFQEQSEQKINSSHVIAEGNPTDEMLEHYAEAIKDAAESAESRMTISEDELDSMESDDMMMVDPNSKFH